MRKMGCFEGNEGDFEGETGSLRSERFGKGKF